MSAEELGQSMAHDFMLGIRTAMSCPDVSVAEYEGVMAYKIAAAIREAVGAEREKNLIEGGPLLRAMRHAREDERLKILEALTQVSTEGTPAQVKEWCLAMVRERGE